MRAITPVGYAAVSSSDGGRVSPTHAKRRRDSLPPSLPIELAEPPNVVAGKGGTDREPLESAQRKLKQAATAATCVPARFIGGRLLGRPLRTFRRRRCLLLKIDRLSRRSRGQLGP